jgi:hypothetical protein
MITPSNLKTTGETKEVLDRVEMPVQAGPITRLALGDADD